jgi:hypothetical protein
MTFDRRRLDALDRVAGAAQVLSGASWNKLNAIAKTNADPKEGHAVRVTGPMVTERRDDVVPPKEITMFVRKSLAALALVGATFAPVTSFARESAPPAPASYSCPLRGHHIMVTPYTVEETPIKTTFKRLAGAQVTVEAEPGLTAEWLRLQIAQHLATMGDPSRMNDCPLRPGDVRVDVQSAGTGFNVKVIAVDPSKAQQVLRSAQALVG